MARNINKHAFPPKKNRVFYAFIEFQEQSDQYLLLKPKKNIWKVKKKQLN